jgi:hypothetical protein
VLEKMNRKLLLTIFLIASLKAVVQAKDWTSITVRNNGGFIARFEVAYVLDSPNIITQKSGNFPLGDSKSILLPPDVMNLNIVLI